MDARLNTTPEKRHRRKSMTNRPGQQGRIVKKGLQWHLRFLEDVAGEYARKDRSVRIAAAEGPNAVSKTRAKQLGAKYLEEKGINTQEHFDKTCTSFTTSPSVATFGDRVKFWQDNKLKHLRPRTKDSMSSAIHLHLLPALGQCPVDAIDEDRAQVFVSALTDKGLSAKTVRTYFGYLRSILGKKKTRDWDDVTLPPLPDNDPFLFSSAHLEKIVNNCDGQNRVLVIVLTLTGMRINECIGLHCEDIDFAARTIRVRRSIYHGKVGPVKTKRGYRLINLNSLAVEVLQAHLHGQGSGIVFPSEVGTYLSDTNLRNRWFRPLIARLGIPQPPRSAFHALRHSRVTALREAGIPDDVVLRWVGHSSLRVTDGYTHRSGDSLSAMAEKIGLSQVVPSPALGLVGKDRKVA
jgi:integrase